MTVLWGEDVRVDAHMVGGIASAFVEFFNKLSPRTTISADEVMVFSKPNNPTAGVRFFQDGCQVSSGTMQLMLLRGWLHDNVNKLYV